MPRALQRVHVLGRNDPAAGHQDVGRPMLVQQLPHPGEERHVGAREDREARPRPRPPAPPRWRSSRASGAARCRPPPSRRRAAPRPPPWRRGRGRRDPGLATSTRMGRGSERVAVMRRVVSLSRSSARAPSEPTVGARRAGPGAPVSRAGPAAMPAALRAHHVHLVQVADVERLLRGHAQGVQRGPEDSRIGLLHPASAESTTTSK